MNSLKIASVLLILACGVASAGNVEGNRPNVILIVTDDQGYGDMACHGNPWLKTPNLDRLYAESVRLEDLLDASGCLGGYRRPTATRAS